MEYSFALILQNKNKKKEKKNSAVVTGRTNMTITGFKLKICHALSCIKRFACHNNVISLNMDTS